MGNTKSQTTAPTLARTKIQMAAPTLVQTRSQMAAPTLARTTGQATAIQETGQVTPQATAVIVDGRIGRWAEETLRSLGLDVIKTVRHPALYDAVAYHPDMVICPVSEDSMVVEPSMFDYFSRALSGRRLNLVKGQAQLSSNYPQNIAYNIAMVGNRAILYSKYADPIAVKEIRSRRLGLIEVKQGYAKCSTAVVNDNAIITSDKGIAKAAGASDIDVLLIRPGYIRLEGFEYGFIGGCCGRLADGIILFSGDPGTHPDWYRIKDFLEYYHIKAIGLDNGPLIDIGSIIPVMGK